MSEETSAEDRTEEPTSRRLQKAREEGEAARSIEVPAAAVLITGATWLLVMGESTANQLRTLLAQAFEFDQSVLADPGALPLTLARGLRDGFLIIAPLLLATLLAAVLASGLTGGYLFSIRSAMPRMDKLNLFSGLARMFSVRALVELLKSIAKFLLVGAAIVFFVQASLPDLVTIGGMNLEPALQRSGSTIATGALVATLSLVAIALLDAFWQRHSFNKRMRMTKQEIRDEMKDAEGRPEIKQQIRRRQREVAAMRMLERIKDADVVITNPEHFAVALCYDPNRDGAPTVVAKGTDELALRFISEARRVGVQVFEAPPLARAIYFTTRLDHPIHEALYFAVAQVIAYVMNLHSFQPGQGRLERPRVTVPPEMQFTPDGTLEQSGAVS
jgi:flagellar biosynthetic protein FlhB